ncbi:site-specific DNA-methyltransferase [Neisseria bacilliformis]|uniref:site-specific DNA-methyltransferase n=1 Tax=Neisseria bacilliformis TaxID=267212 RepID=UPI0028EA057C|nr:site-specific DNA-methyltransferase [Neisseria bacilliformis]
MTARDDLFSRPAPSEERLYLLKKQFPECFDKNGAFVPERLAESLRSDGLPVQKEYYSLNWLGKSYAKVLRDAPPETLLAEDAAHNRQPENAASQNLLLKGDNLEILKHLKHAYAGAVKMIYIDPPYNTGSDGFVYQDDRRFTPEQLARLGGMDLDEACRVLEFTAKKSNSHSAWLTFMYPRLYIARELLREDGVIFISIDDNEQAQLKILCDEVFGEENFVADLIWKKKNVVQNDARFFSTDHEYILCYAKSADALKLNRLARTAEQEARYQNPDNDPRGVWTSVALQAKSGSSTYQITFPNGVSWQPVEGTFPRLSKASLLKAYEENRLWFGKDGKNVPRLKKYLSEVQDGVLSNTVWMNEIVGSTQSSKENLKKMLGNNVFDTPKPIELLQRMISLATSETDLILDFFAGSGTTAHAVMQLNAEDGENGRRRFILAQLPEPTDKKSEAYKAGYETIFQITQARLEKAAAKIRADHPHYTGDLGFKIFATVPHFQAASDEAFDPQQPLLPESVRADLSPEQLDTLLTTWRVYDGCPLTAPVRPLDLAGYTAHLCGGNVYFMAAGCTSQTVKALIEKLDSDADFTPERVIFYGANMASAMQRELAQAVEGYANKKSLKLNVLARY